MKEAEAEAIRELPATPGRVVAPWAVAAEASSRCRSLRPPANPLPDLLQDVTGVRFVDIALHVFGKKESIVPELVGRPRDCLHVPGVILVALLERFARVADCQALGLGRLEGNVLAVRLTAVVAPGRGRPQRPAGRGGDRRLDARQADAGDFVAVLVHLRDKDRIGRTAYDRW